MDTLKKFKENKNWSDSDLIAIFITMKGLGDTLYPGLQETLSIIEKVMPDMANNPNFIKTALKGCITAIENYDSLRG